MPILCRYLIAVAILPVLGACDLHKNLTETLLGQLSHKLRPVKHPDEKLNVYIQSALYQVVEIWWWDPHLTWEPANFDHVTKTFLHSSEVWMPDLYLYHSVQGSTPFTVKDSAVQVDFQGKVSIFVPFTAQAFCPVNVKHFPFDTQKCSFTFGAWSYTSEAIEYIVVNEEVYLGGFYDNQEWLLTDSSLTPGISNYSTPKHNDTYAFVQMELTLQRQGFYYVFNLVIPSTLVTFVFVVGVHVPIDSSAPPRRSNRFRLAITTLLSMGVMLLMLVEDMPKFAITTIEGQRGSFSSIPLLGLYYISLITLVSVCSITCTVFVKMERYAMKYKEYKCIPKYLRCLAPAPPIEIRSSNYNLSPATRSENGLVTRKTNFQFDNPERTILQEVSQKVNDICHKIEHQIDRTNEHLSKENLPRHWDVLIKRLEKMSLAIYVSLVVIVIIMFLGHDIWY